MTKNAFYVAFAVMNGNTNLEDLKDNVFRMVSNPPYCDHYGLYDLTVENMLVMKRELKVYKSLFDVNYIKELLEYHETKDDDRLRYKLVYWEACYVLNFVNSIYVYVEDERRATMAALKAMTNYLELIFELTKKINKRCDDKKVMASAAEMSLIFGNVIIQLYEMYGNQNDHHWKSLWEKFKAMMFFIYERTGDEEIKNIYDKCCNNGKTVQCTEKIELVMKFAEEIIGELAHPAKGKECVMSAEDSEILLAEVRRIVYREDQQGRYEHEGAIDMTASKEKLWVTVYALHEIFLEANRVMGSRYLLWKYFPPMINSVIKSHIRESTIAKKSNGTPINLEKYLTEQWVSSKV